MSVSSQSRSCCIDRSVRLPVLMARAPSMAPTALNAQHAPQNLGEFHLDTDFEKPSIQGSHILPLVLDSRNRPLLDPVLFVRNFEFVVIFIILQFFSLYVSRRGA